MYASPKICVLIPTYNNAGTLADVIAGAKRYCQDIIVVNDGCTDDTRLILENAGVEVCTHDKNRGKGKALVSGFLRAKDLGYTHAVTMDSDGQHYPEDLPLFIEAVRNKPEAIIVGCRNLAADNMPGGNSFANNFSNFWFRLYTGVALQDTQTGYRAYPLDSLRGLSLLTSRYEAELELLVFSSWRGVELHPVPIRVYYQPKGERISHFRPFRDFMRISLLNTFLLFASLLYGLPCRILRLFRKNP